MATRVILTQYRAGSLAAGTGTPPTIDPAWMRIYNLAGGAPQTVNRTGIAAVTGEFTVPRTADVQVGDFFRLGLGGGVSVDNLTPRAFQALQVIPEPASQKILFVEIFPPIPDEFESGLLDAWWTPQYSPAVDNATGELVIENAGPELSGNDPSDCPFIYQTINGDFDCFSWLKTDKGSGGAVRYGLLMAHDAVNDDLVAVGVKSAGTGLVYHRFDSTTANTETNGPTFTDETFGFVRLKREGKRFRSFYANAVTVPTEESEWTEILPPSDQYQTANDVRVGLAGFQKTGTDGSMRFRFLRNWKSEARSL